jgi:hypothetical protein
LGRGDLTRRVAVDTAEDHARRVYRARRASPGHGDKVLLPHERIAIDGEPRVIRELFDVKRQDLEVRPVVARRDQAESLDLGGNELRALVIAETADLAAHHRIVGELVETNLKIAWRNRRRRWGRCEARRVTVMIELRSRLPDGNSRGGDRGGDGREDMKA